MNIKDLLHAVIPPNDREHREGFSNISILKALSDNERMLLADELINKLELQVEQKLSIDTLIIHTLQYIHSIKSISTLYKVLNSGLNNFDKIITSGAIYKLNGDAEMINIAIDAFVKIDNKVDDPNYIYTLIFAFDHMVNFNVERTTVAVEKYVNHDENLVSYNAKKALGYI